MRFKFLMLCFLMAAAHGAHAEGGCPPGQYPIGGQGAAGCAPIPQSGAVEQSNQPAGRWIKTWGAIAMGMVDGVPNYGVPVGEKSKAEAESDAVMRCAKRGATGCEVLLSYFNQCAALSEPIGEDGKISGNVVAVGSATVELAESRALEKCARENAGAHCEVSYKACSTPFFEKY